MAKNLSEDFEILDSIKKKIEDDGDNHLFTNLDTPILDDAFDYQMMKKLNVLNLILEKLC